MNDLWALISPDEAWDALFVRGPRPLLLIQPAHGRVLAANDAACALYGYEPGAMEGLELDDLVDPSAPNPLSQLASPPSGPPVPNGGRHRRKSGGTFHAHVQVVRIDARGGPLAVVAVDDRSEPDLIDAASGLPDPRLFVDRLEQSVVHAHRAGHGLAVCLLLIDRLDALLANLPADGASRLLHDLGDRLRANLRESDTVARVGKAEFAIIIEGPSEERSIVEVLRKVLDDFSYEFRVGDEDLILQASVGVSVYPHDGHEADMLVENAATAARNAMGSGAGSIHFFGDE